MQAVHKTVIQVAEGFQLMEQTVFNIAIAFDINDLIYFRDFCLLINKKIQPLETENSLTAGFHLRITNEAANLK